MKNNENAQFDKYAETYDEVLEKSLRGYIGSSDIYKFAEYKIQLLKSVIPNKVKNVLDFGCGTGRSLLYLKEYFGDSVNYFGCDVSKESIKVARHVLPEANFFVNYPIQTMYDNKEKYDLVFLACVLHHIEPAERVKWIQAIMGNLEDDGYIAIFEHNLKNPYTKRIVCSPENEMDNVDYMLSHKELIDLFKEAAPELKVFWHGYTLFSPYRFKGITQLEKVIKWLPIGAQQCVIFKKTSQNNKN